LAAAPPSLQLSFLNNSEPQNMTSRETRELEETVQKIDVEALKKSLEMNTGDSKGKKSAIVQGIGNKVLELGIQGFVKALQSKWVRDTWEVVKHHAADKAAKAPRKQDLAELILQMGLEYFLQECNLDLLNHFSSVLLLEQSTKEGMVSQIADEIMLTGTNGFLHNLSVPLLKQWCQSLSVKTVGAKKVLSERLMVKIFDLEPLPEGELEGSQVEETKEEEEEEEEEEEQDETKTKKQDQGNETEKDQEYDAAAKKSDSGGKRAKYVAPPISTIQKGKTKQELHSLFNAKDLQEYCRQHDMLASGKKPLLIKRILKYLDTGEKEIPKGRKVTGKRKRTPQDADNEPVKKVKGESEQDSEKQEMEPETKMEDVKPEAMDLGTAPDFGQAENGDKQEEVMSIAME